MLVRFPEALNSESFIGAFGRTQLLIFIVLFAGQKQMLRGFDPTSTAYTTDGMQLEFETAARRLPL